MSIIKKKPLFSAIFIVLFITLGIFAKDIYRKQTSEIQELKILNKELYSRIESLTIENVKVKLELTEQKNLLIVEQKNADGSSTKTISKSSNKNVKKDSEIEKIQIQKEDKVEKQEELTKIDKKEEKIEKKSSPLKPILWIVGGVAICVLTGICVF